MQIQLPKLHTIIKSLHEKTHVKKNFVIELESDRLQNQINGKVISASRHRAFCIHARKTLSENLTWDLKLSGTIWSRRKACHVLPMVATPVGDTLSSLSVSHILSKLPFDQSICACTVTTLKKVHGPKCF